MKKVTKKIIIIILIIIIAFILSIVSNKEYMKIKEGIGKIQIEYKGINDGIAFDFDEQGNLYIATKDSLKLININGNVNEILKDKKADIYSMRYLKGKVYFLDRIFLKSFDLKNKEVEVLIDNIPNYGKNKSGKIIVKNNYLYLSVGSISNSGIAEKGLEEGNFCDLSPRDLTLNGDNFGENLTGPFLPYGNSAKKGQVITGVLPANSCVLKYDLINKKEILYSWGIKSIEAFDYDSKGDLYSIVSGFENDGARAIKGDVDYIYKLEQDKWYGWPDYSGGEPINSELFSGPNGEKVNFVLDNHPFKSVPKPIYENQEVSTLKSLVIDREKQINEKEKIYFYDKNLGSINTLDFNGENILKITFKEKDDIVDLRINNNKMYGLNKSKGIIFSLKFN